MNRGLAEYNQDDSLFTRAFGKKMLLTSVFTGAWYIFASRIHFFNSAQTLKYSLPLAVFFSYQFSKGFVNHYVAAKETTRRLEVRRTSDLYQLNKQIRSHQA